MSSKFVENVTLQRKIVSLLFALMLITLTPLLTLILSPLYLFRVGVKKVAKKIRPDLGKMLTTVGNFFAVEYPTMFQTGTKCAVYVTLVRSGPMSFEEYRQEFLEKVVHLKKLPPTPTAEAEYVNPELMQTITSFLGYLFWQWDPNFQIENHFKMYNGPGKIEGVTVDNDIPLIMKELGQRPFVAGRSPWEMWVWDVKSEDDASSSTQKKIFVFRIHHSIADGYSILKLLIGDLHGMSMETVYAQQNSQNDNNDRKLGGHNFGQKFINLFTFLCMAPFQMAQMIVEAWDFNDWHRPEEQLTGRLNSAMSGPIPLEFVKQIKNIHGCSFQTVIQAAVAGGMRNFFIQQNIKIPNPNNMHCLLPLPANRIRTKLRNQMLAAMAPLPVQISDPKNRIRCIETSLNKLRNSTAPLACFYLIPLTGALPAVVIKKMAKQLTTTCLFSNFPGSSTPIVVGHTRLDDVCFGAGLLVGNLGIGVNVLSYNGGIRIWICADEAILKDPSLVKILLSKSVQELQTLRDCQE